MRITNPVNRILSDRSCLTVFDMTYDSQRRRRNFVECPHRGTVFTFPRGDSGSLKFKYFLMNTSNYSLWLKIIVLCLLGSSFQSTFAASSYTKYWSTASITGSVSKDSSYKYYLEPQIRLIDTPSVFDQFLLMAGAGYQFNPDLMFLTGAGWIYNRSPETNTNTEEKRLWQQINLGAMTNSNFSLNSRTRLEERSQEGQSQIALRFRERLWLRVPVKQWETYSFSCYDELFFNLNHPQWTSPHLFEQNRAFIGIGRQLFQSATLDIGYLNQFNHSFTNQTSNVVLLAFSMSS